MRKKKDGQSILSMNSTLVQAVNTLGWIHYRVEVIQFWGNESSIHAPDSHAEVDIHLGDYIYQQGRFKR